MYLRINQFSDVHCVCFGCQVRTRQAHMEVRPLLLRASRVWWQSSWCVGPARGIPEDWLLLGDGVWQVLPYRAPGFPGRPIHVLTPVHRGSRQDLVCALCEGVQRPWIPTHSSSEP